MGQRWRVILADGGRAFRIEVDTGAGFRPASVVEVDAALRNTSFVAEHRRNVPRDTKRNTNRNTERSAPERPEHPASVGVERSPVPRGTPVERSAEHPPAFRGTSAERNAEIRRRRAAGESIRTIARAIGIGNATVDRALRRG